MTLGILGGGQLGYMLALAGYPLGLHFRFLDPSPEAPVGRIAQRVTADYTDHAALERFANGLELVTVNPGLVMTPDWQKTAKLLTEGKDISWEEYLDQIAKDNAPIGRFASPEEIANLFVFLCSPRASYCVGSTYYIDGGWLRTTK